MAVAITATEQDVYPPRVLVSVTGLTIGDAVEVYRVVGGERTLVRAGSDDSVTDTSFLRVDAEVPFSVPVSYVAVVNGTDEYTTTPDTYTLTGGLPVVTDAISGLAAEAKILAWDEKRYNRPSSVFQVGGRNVVVADDWGQFEGTVEFVTEETSSRDNLMTTLTDATEGVVQIRQPGGYDGVDSYVSVIGASERRHSQDGSDQRRIISVDAVETDSWAPSLEGRGFTLQDIADAYAGTEATVLIKEWAFASTTESWTNGGSGTLTRVASPSEAGDGSLQAAGGSAMFGPQWAVAGGIPVVASYRLFSTTSQSINMIAFFYDSVGTLIDSTSNFSGPTIPASTWTTVSLETETPSNAAEFALRVSCDSATPTFQMDWARLDEVVGEMTNLSNDFATLLDIAQADWS